MKDEDLSAATDKMRDMKIKKEDSKELNKGSVDLKDVKKIVFACDAGMGSSAMGASTLRKKVQKAGLDILVINKAINEIPNDADIIITHENLTDRARAKAPSKMHLSIQNFIGSPVYDDLVSDLVEVQTVGKAVREESAGVNKNILLKKNIILNQEAKDKFEAIEFVGKLLVDSGYVKNNYIEGMKAREKSLSTYIGNGVAIPHGDSEYKDEILNSGIVVVQYPGGIEFEDGDIANLLIGIAGKGDEHLKILANLASVLEDNELSKELASTNDKEKIYSVLMEEF